jgi:acetylornithine deacetylase/succinyl-diaminopimelate desuccinylase-like protein
MAGWEAYLEAHKAQYLEELIELLRIPSISALPEHAADVQHAAEWVARRLTAAGLEHVRIMLTPGHPVLYADHLHAPGKPTILIYGHFDVQPVDPVALWTSPPFEPAVRDGRVYARGASDNKGNVLAPIQALEALLRAEGALPVNVKFLIEGQEEIGSPDVPDFLAVNRDLYACDLVLNADTGQLGEEEPALFLGARGLCAVQVDVRGPNQDLHSGTFGGAVANPIHALVRILDSLRDAQGKVLVPGFYDRVRELTAEERQAIAAVPYHESAITTRLDVEVLPGEAGYTPAERVWVRPTLELNGIWGGFQGEGAKTVLPSEAHAKITCRLVANQDPGEIVQLVIDHIQRQPAPGVQVAAHEIPGQAIPYAIDADHWGNIAVAGVLERIYGKAPYHIRTGGSIPVCTLFGQILHAPTIGLGFGLDDENLHAPDEFWRLKSLERSRMAYCMVLPVLAEQTSPA